jgi:hypothetical protein
LRIPEYLWEIDGLDYVTDLPKNGIDGYTSFFYGLPPYKNGSLCSMPQTDHNGGVGGFIY